MKRPNLKNKRVLITGATGFIGSNLLRSCLDDGAIVSIFVREESDLWRVKGLGPGLKKYKVSLTDDGLLLKTLKKIRPEIIFHTAAYGGRPDQSDLSLIADVNLKGTINLIDNCQKIDYELLVNSGSSSEYGIKGLAMREDDPLEPYGPYGFYKAAASIYAQNVSRDSRKPIVTLRLFSPFGYFEDSSRLVPSVILSCLNQEDIKLSSPEAVRDFVFIEDVIDAYKKAYEYRLNSSGMVFNIGSGSQHTVGEVVNKIIKLTKSSSRPRWGTVRNIRTEPRHWQADIGSAKKELRWHPRHSLDQGLSKTIKWFQENIRLYN